MTIKQLMKSDPETINSVLALMRLAVKLEKVEGGKLSAYISFREAAKKYGPAVVKAWKDEGLIQFIQDGPNKKIRIDRIRLETVAKESNRGNYKDSNETK